jgi:hypothetical protein
MFLKTTLCYSFAGQPDPSQWSVQQLLEIQDGAPTRLIVQNLAATYGWLNANPQWTASYCEQGELKLIKLTSNWLEQVILAEKIKV